jgi:hypothetical protein
MGLTLPEARLPGRRNSDRSVESVTPLVAEKRSDKKWRPQVADTS